MSENKTEEFKWKKKIEKNCQKRKKKRKINTEAEKQDENDENINIDEKVNSD